jgi:hypothetical protein
MKRNLLIGVFFLLSLQTLFAQGVQRRKIAVFTPIYLDSVYNRGVSYAYGKTYPKFVVPGLDFYYGARLALDTLQKRGAALEVYFYDSRSREGLAAQLANPEIEGMEMIIASSNMAETKMLAEAAAQKKIPFISASLPNDAGVFNNPYFVVLNSTLQAHVEGIYNFLQKSHAKDNIIFFRKGGQQEEKLYNFFTDYAKNIDAKTLKVKFINTEETGMGVTMLSALDSTKNNVCIVGSLDEGYGKYVLNNLAEVSATYPLTVIGMPTWDNVSFKKSDFPGLSIIYSTPFYYNHSTLLESRLAAGYTDKLSNKPTDMFFRGFETMMRFGSLLNATKTDIASNLSGKAPTIFTPFDIEPVFKDKSTMTLDYFENRHLYFIKITDGVKTLVY